MRNVPFRAPDELVEVLFELSKVEITWIESILLWLTRLIGSNGAKAPKSKKCVSQEAARAARIAGFEVGGKHLAKQAWSAPTVLPTRRALGNSSVPT